MSHLPLKRYFHVTAFCSVFHSWKQRVGGRGRGEERRAPLVLMEGVKLMTNVETKSPFQQCGVQNCTPTVHVK